MKNSAIEWTHHTFNPWLGCTEVSPACANCYARTWSLRAGRAHLWHGKRERTSAENWRGPAKWNRDAAARGARERVFTASLADVFDNEVPAQWRADLFEVIRSTPSLDWLLLTKRIGNARRMLPQPWRAEDWPNVWLGATVVTQEEVARDVPKLAALSAAVRFLSIEPLIEAINFAGLWVDHPDPRMHENLLERIDWMIVGGESGGQARPLEVEWCTVLREQCAAIGTKFFMKQGSGANWPSYKDFATFPEQLRVREIPAPFGA